MTSATGFERCEGWADIRVPVPHPTGGKPVVLWRDVGNVR